MPRTEDIQAKWSIAEAQITLQDDRAWAHCTLELGEGGRADPAELLSCGKLAHGMPLYFDNA